MIVRFFITTAVALVLILALAQGDIQNLGKLADSYDFYGNAITDDVYSFSSEPEAERIINWIVSQTGLSTNFTLRRTNIQGAFAKVVDGERVVFYNLEFIQGLKQDAGTDWAAIAILAHEVAHHLNWHTLEGAGSRPPEELQADYFAGFYLARMGATLDEAKAAYETLPPEGSATHPPRSARLTQIANGWYAVKGTENSVLPPRLSTRCSSSTSAYSSASSSCSSQQQGV